MIPRLSIGPRTLLNDCNHSATAIFWRSAILWPRPGQIGLAASQMGLVITTSDVTHAIGGSVELWSAIPCHSMLWRDVTLHYALYFDIVFDVIGCT